MEKNPEKKEQNADKKRQKDKLQVLNLYSLPPLIALALCCVLIEIEIYFSDRVDKLIKAVLAPPPRTSNKTRNLLPQKRERYD